MTWQDQEEPEQLPSPPLHCPWGRLGEMSPPAVCGSWVKLRPFARSRGGTIALPNRGQSRCSHHPNTHRLTQGPHKSLAHENTPPANSQGATKLTFHPGKKQGPLPQLGWCIAEGRWRQERDTGGIPGCQLQGWVSGRPMEESWLPPSVSFWASSPALLANPGGAWHRAGTQQPLCVVPGTHSTVRVDLGAFHGDGDTVEEDDDKDHMVEHLVRDDPVTEEAEPAPGQRPRLSRRQAVQQ